MIFKQHSIDGAADEKNLALDNDTADKEAVKASLSDIEVTSHTASLWKYIPIPESPEPFPEYRSSYDKFPFAEVTAARVRGKMHKHSGTNCDDWYDYTTVGDWVIAVVSDGAGSKPFSRIGAKASCEAAVKNLKSEFAAVQEMCPDISDTLGMPFESAEFGNACAKLVQLVQMSFKEAFTAVENAYMARSNKSEFEKSIGKKPILSDYSATLLAAVVIPVQINGSREHFVISLQIGDGMIASVNRNADYENALRILGTADSGGFAGETDFITSEHARSADSISSHTKIQRGKMSAVMLMTDGVADDYYPNNPQLLRLYTDLEMNGVISLPSSWGSAECPSEITVPEPLLYPWVNDGDVKYSLQYAKNVMEKTGLSLEKLWNKKNRGVIEKASLGSFGISNGKDKSEALSVWLDNYVERGSFDDRTLLIVNVGDGE